MMPSGSWLMAIALRFSSMAWLSERIRRTSADTNSGADMMHQRAICIFCWFVLSPKSPIRSCNKDKLNRIIICEPRGFAKLKKFQKKLGWSSPHPPTPIQTFVFFETHHLYGKNTQIIITNTFNNVYTNRIHLVYYSKILVLV